MVTPVPHAGVRPHRKASVVSAGRDSMLTDDDFRGCRWIEGDPSPLRRGMFCGLRVPSGESWCKSIAASCLVKTHRRSFCRRVWPEAPPGMAEAAQCRV